MTLGFLLGVACSGDPTGTVVEPVLQEVSPAPTAPVTAPAPLQPTDGTPQVEHRFEGVGALYQGFFKDEELSRRLARSVQPCVGDDVYLYVSYDEATRVGRLTLRVEPDVLSCRPRELESGWDLSPVVPISVALAAYRDGVASRYDLRVASFAVQVATRTPHSLCTIRASGTHPPDGRGFAACVQHDLVERCGAESASGTTLLGIEGADKRALRSCFIP